MTENVINNIRYDDKVLISKLELLQLCEQFTELKLILNNSNSENLSMALSFSSVLLEKIQLWCLKRTVFYQNYSASSLEFRVYKLIQILWLQLFFSEKLGLDLKFFLPVQQLFKGFHANERLDYFIKTFETRNSILIQHLNKPESLENVISIILNEEFWLINISVTEHFFREFPCLVSNSEVALIHVGIEDFSSITWTLWMLNLSYEPLYIFVHLILCDFVVEYRDFLLSKCKTLDRDFSDEMYYWGVEYLTDNDLCLFGLVSTLTLLKFSKILENDILKQDLTHIEQSNKIVYLYLSPVLILWKNYILNKVWKV